MHVLESFHIRITAAKVALAKPDEEKQKAVEVVVTEDVIKELPPDFGNYRWIDLVQVKGSSLPIA